MLPASGPMKYHLETPDSAWLAEMPWQEPAMHIQLFHPGATGIVTLAISDDEMGSCRYMDLFRLPNGRFLLDDENQAITHTLQIQAMLFAWHGADRLRVATREPTKCALEQTVLMRGKPKYSL